jgi:hypothetical protein
VCSPERGVFRYSDRRFLISDSSVSKEREEAPSAAVVAVPVALELGLETILEVGE